MIKNAQKVCRLLSIIVQTFIASYANIILVKTPIHYIVFATPHMREIPSPKETVSALADTVSCILQIREITCFPGDFEIK